MTSSQENRVRITGGPCKFDLMLSLFDGKEVTLKTEEGDIVVKFSRLMLEDGSRQRWLFSVVDTSSTPWEVRTGYYDMKGRRGFIENKA